MTTQILMRVWSVRECSDRFRSRLGGIFLGSGVVAALVVGMLVGIVGASVLTVGSGPSHAHGGTDPRAVDAADRMSTPEVPLIAIEMAGTAVANVSEAEASNLLGASGVHVRLTPVLVAPRSAVDDVGLSNRGLVPAAGTRVRPTGIPDDWRTVPTRGDGGVRYYDPTNAGNSVRVMQGSPNSPFPNSQAP